MHGPASAFSSVILFALTASLFLSQPVRAADDFEPRVQKSADNKSLPYRLFKPKDYDANKKYPLVIFFHGAGERGDDNQRQVGNGVEIFARAENQAKNPCFIFAPQCPAGKQWVDVPWADDGEVQPAEPSEPMKLAIEAIDAIQKEFSIDADRLYVTGLSMGGFGTWDLITRFPDRFAAAVPICGGGDEKQAAKIAKLPIWAFHGAIDNVVKPIRSRNMIQALREAGGQPGHTEYPSVGHFSWGLAYNEPELMPWLFAQHRGK